MKSGSKKAVGYNIGTEERAGKKPKQAIAIALSIARHAKKKAHGGMMDEYAHGGKVLEHEHHFHEGEDPHALTTRQRDAIPGHDFALPGRRYPIENEAHARNALARVSQYGSPEEKEEVRHKVHEKYPDIGEEKEAHGGEMHEHPMHALGAMLGEHFLHAMKKAQGGLVDEGESDEDSGAMYQPAAESADEDDSGLRLEPEEHEDAGLHLMPEDEEEKEPHRKLKFARAYFSHRAMGHRG